VRTTVLTIVLSKKLMMAGNILGIWEFRCVNTILMVKFLGQLL
jgi:hypothetical protein